MKHLLVDSMLCFSCDRPVTDNCPILVLKKMYKIEKILPAARSCTHQISTEMKVIFKSILILMSTKKKTHSVSLNTHHVKSECSAA